MLTFDVKRAFFVIDSEHLDEVNSELYGFYLGKDQVITDIEEFLKVNGEAGGEGAYIAVEVDAGKITIKQDHVGAWGIYIYQKGERFIFSNSFLRLSEYLNENTLETTLNHPYTMYRFATMTSWTHEQTAYNEVSFVGRDILIEIDKYSKTYNFEQLPLVLEENSIEIDSWKGMRTLDTWHSRWVRLIENLAAAGYDLTFNLSGGFDSRLTIMLLLTSNIDLSKVTIHSLDDGVAQHIEDYEIAKEISSRFGFALNKRPDLTAAFTSVDSISAIDMSFYLKGDTHNEMSFKTSVPVKPRYFIGGLGGELLHNFKHLRGETPEEIVHNHRIKSVKLMQRSPYGVETGMNSVSVLEPTVAFAQSIVSVANKTKEDLRITAYRPTINRYHFGRNTVEDFFGNRFHLGALMDRELWKLKIKTASCDDLDLLYCVLLERYLPELLEFPFEGARSISPATRQIAREIVSRYPRSHEENLSQDFVPTRASAVEGVRRWLIELPADDSSQASSRKEIDASLLEKFRSDVFRETFISHFSENLYQWIDESVTRRGIAPLAHVYTALYSMRFLENKKPQSADEFWRHLVQRFESTSLGTSLAMRIPNMFAMPSQMDCIDKEVSISASDDERYCYHNVESGLLPGIYSIECDLLADADTSAESVTIRLYDFATNSELSSAIFTGEGKHSVNFAVLDDFPKGAILLYPGTPGYTNSKTYTGNVSIGFHRVRQ